MPLVSVWKEAWHPLESPSWAKETLLSPGNLGPSQLFQMQTLDEWTALQQRADIQIPPERRTNRWDTDEI